MAALLESNRSLTIVGHGVFEHLLINGRSSRAAPLTGVLAAALLRMRKTLLSPEVTGKI
jgi:hypothetical protein